MNKETDNSESDSPTRSHAIEFLGTLVGFSIAASIYLAFVILTPDFGYSKKHLSLAIALLLLPWFSQLGYNAEVERHKRRSQAGA